MNSYCKRFNNLLMKYDIYGKNFLQNCKISFTTNILDLLKLTIAHLLFKRLSIAFNI